MVLRCKPPVRTNGQAHTKDMDGGEHCRLVRRERARLRRRGRLPTFGALIWVPPRGDAFVMAGSSVRSMALSSMQPDNASLLHLPDHLDPQGCESSIPRKFSALYLPGGASADDRHNGTCLRIGSNKLAGAA